MGLEQKIYLCNQCKKVIDDVEELLFVEENSTRGFCSEKCIEDFYSPIFTWYENQEKEIRKELSLLSESSLKLLDDPGQIDKLLGNPDEIWCQTNDLNEEIYSFIGKYQNKEGGVYYLMCICLLYEKKPSFIFVATATESEELVNKFRFGEQVEDLSSYIGSGLGPEGSMGSAEEEEMEDLLQGIESKKGTFLAELLEKRSPADIPFENFPLYDMYFEKTIEEPDEIYSYQDDEGDTIFVYIKAHEKEGVSFYYFVVSYNFQSNYAERLESLLPIISFPSVDPELYRSYCKGERLTGSLKN